MGQRWVTWHYCVLYSKHTRSICKVGEKEEERIRRKNQSHERSETTGFEILLFGFKGAPVHTHNSREEINAFPDFITYKFFMWYVYFI